MSTVEQNSTAASEWPCSNDEYHADHSAVGASMLERFRQSPALYHGMYVTRTIPPEPSTEAMRIGTVTHTLCLEPERFDEVVAMIPDSALAKDGSRRGQAWQEWLASIGSKIPLRPRDADGLRRIADAVQSNPQAAELLRRVGPTEHPVRWDDSVTGLKCKARFDKISEEFLVDLKTTSDPSPAAFAASAARYGYHRQGAHYLNGVASLTDSGVQLLHIAVGTSAPFDCHVFELDEKAMEHGRRQNRILLNQLAECIRTGVFRSPCAEQVTLLSLPRWSFFDEYEP